MSAVAETTRRPPRAESAQPIPRPAPNRAAPPRIIRERRDLAFLPGPRVLAIAPFDLRAGIAILAGSYVLLGAWRLAAVLAGLPAATNQEAPLALLTILLGVGLQATLKPWDRDRWIHFAVAGDGLYLPGRGRRVVFVPWFALVRVEAEPARGRRSATVRLTLRLDEQNWARISRFARVRAVARGEARERVFHLPTRPGEAPDTVARIEALNPLG